MKKSLMKLTGDLPNPPPPHPNPSTEHYLILISKNTENKATDNRQRIRYNQKKKKDGMSKKIKNKKWGGSLC